jgi:flagellar hook-length control protein FliK
VTDYLNWTAASIPDGPTVAVQASKVLAEAFGGTATQLTSGPLDASASQNGSSLPAHVSIAGAAAPNPTAGTQAGSAAMHIGTPVQDAAWSNELGSRVVLMSGQQLQSAKIQLSPAELGPITVNLVIDDGSAELTFHAHHALTREAIEQALPRLREMLNDNGLTLGNATVSDQGAAKDGSGRAARDASGIELPASDTTVRDESTDARPARILQGLLDTFV